MSQVQLYPYPTRPNALRLTCEPEAPEIAIGETGHIEAQGVPESGSIRLNLVVQAEADTVAAVLPQAELVDPPIEMVVTVRSVASRYRTALRLDPDEDGIWSGTLDTPKTAFFGEIKVEPTLVRSAAGQDPGYAQHMGARLAWGDPVVVQVDEAAVPPGGYLEIRFEDFKDSPVKERREHPELLYMLDTNKETPMLLLNEGIREFKTVMLAKGPRGRNLRIRDAMFDTIVSQVWTSLASIAFTTLAVNTAQLAETESREDPLDSLPEWGQRVINLWAQQLYPGSRLEALEAVTNAARHPTLFPELHDRLGIAIQERARTGHAYQGLLRLRDREGM